jgi:hypothetical protein
MLKLYGEPRANASLESERHVEHWPGYPYYVFPPEFHAIFAEPRIRPSRSLGIDTKLPLRVRFNQREAVWRVAPVLPVLAVSIRNSADGRPRLV